MDELVARVFAAAEGGEQAVVDQVFQAGTGFPWVPITHSAPVIPSAWNLAPFLENALLVLGETGAAIADKPFLESIKMGAGPLGEWEETSGSAIRGCRSFTSRTEAQGWLKHPVFYALQCSFHKACQACC
jgi:hypothetical protein